MSIVEDEDIGGLIARWRKARRLSQLALALDCDVSAKHLSFLETGRSRPSRDMVLRLCRALAVPPRERNAFLLAAGFAPAYRETPLERPEMSEVVAALALMLERHEPFPALALDRMWDIVMVNAAYGAAVNRVLRPDEPKLVAYRLCPPPRANVLRLLVRPDGYRQFLENWPEVVRAVLGRVQREVAREPDPARRALLAEVTRDPDIAALLDEVDPLRPAPLLVPVRMGAGQRFISTIATLGTAEDLTLQDLRIEAFHPADAATAAAIQAAVR